MTFFVLISMTSPGLEIYHSLMYSGIQDRDTVVEETNENKKEVSAWLLDVLVHLKACFCIVLKG